MLYISPSIVIDPVQLRSLAYPAILWDNLVTTDGIAVDSENTDYPGTNLGNPQTSSVWKSLLTTPQSLTFTIDPGAPVDGIAIARHNFGSGAVGVKIYGITAAMGAVYTLLADLAPGDDSPILAIVAADYYVGIRIDLTPTSVIPQAAVVYIGSLLRLIVGVAPGFSPPEDALQTEMLGGVAENGDFLGDVIVSERRSTALSVKQIDPDWYRANLRPFLQARVPFFLAWAPTTYPFDVSYSKFEGSPQAAINQVVGLYDVDFRITGLAL